MTNRIQRGDLQVSEELDKLITEKVENPIFTFDNFIERIPELSWF